MHAQTQGEYYPSPKAWEPRDGGFSHLQPKDFAEGYSDAAARPTGTPCPIDSQPSWATSTQCPDVSAEKKCLTDMCISSQINSAAISRQLLRSEVWDLKGLHGISHASAIKINPLYHFENLSLELSACGTQGKKREEKRKGRMNPETFQIYVVTPWHLLIIS